MNYPLTNLFENGATWRKNAFCSLLKVRNWWNSETLLGIISFFWRNSCSDYINSKSSLFKIQTHQEGYEMSPYKVSSSFCNFWKKYEVFSFSCKLKKNDIGNFRGEGTIWLYTHMPSLIWIVWKTNEILNITHCSECCVGSLLQYNKNQHFHPKSLIYLWLYVTAVSITRYIFIGLWRY